jgi:hypothetical protein
MKACLFCLVCILAVAGRASAQTQYPPFPNGMRVQAGGSGVLPRNTPSANGTCGTDNHTCTAADAIVPGTYGVIQPDPPVLDPGGWYWSKVVYDNGVTGWSSAYPPYLNMLSPPQMISGVDFNIVGDYAGPALVQGVCINDGVSSAAQLQLQVSASGQSGTLICPLKAPGIGNHIAVIRAVNNAGTTPSTEFQFSVTAAAIPQPPAAPQGLRIAPTSMTTQTLGTAAPATGAKPATEKPK